jgi:hypothetical protein
LLALSGLTDIFGIITERVLSAQFFGNTRKSGVQISGRVCLKNSAARISRQFFEITRASDVIFAAAARASAALRITSATAVNSAAAAQNIAQNIA